MRFVGAVVVVAISLATSSAQALTTQECSAKYKAAQADGTIKDVKWSTFRRSECGIRAAKKLPQENTMPGERPASSVSSWGVPAGRPQ